MLRYYVAATCIVLTAAVFATAWSNRDRLRTVVSSHATQQHYAASSTPHGGFEGQGGSGGAPIRGDAPWALSALPSCLIQQREAQGTLAYARSKLPAGATPVKPGTILHYGPCTILVRDGEALVLRGDDRLRIPPHVTLYRAGEALVLLRDSGLRGELRVYSISNF